MFARHVSSNLLYLSGTRVPLTELALGTPEGYALLCLNKPYFALGDIRDLQSILLAVLLAIFSSFTLLIFLLAHADACILDYF